MNATQNTNVQFTTEIVARFSEQHGPLAILRTDEEQPKEVQAVVIDKGDVITLPIEAYKKTQRVSRDDMQHIVEIYRTLSNINEAVVMERRGYRKKKADELPSRLVQVNEETNEVKVDQKVADEINDPEVKAVVQHIVDKSQAKTEEQPKQKRAYSKKSDYWKNPTKKRKSAARSEAQKKRVEQEMAATAVEQGKDDSFRQQVEAAINSTESTPAEVVDPALVQRVTEQVTKAVLEALTLKKAA